MRSFPLPSPREINETDPLSPEDFLFIKEKREEIIEILRGKDKRILLIVGPCSIHDRKGTLEIALKLQQLEEKVSEHFVFIFRCFVEKPRTAFSWKGFLSNPFLEKKETPETLLKGLSETRSLLKELLSLKIALGTECLEPLLAPYFESFFSWGCIGARTSFSQPHRELASYLPYPVGFKNNVDGSLEGALQGIRTSLQPQIFVGFNQEGEVTAFHTEGNKAPHLILRGGEKESNCDVSSFKNSLDLLEKESLSPSILIDCAHGNSKKNNEIQKENFVFLMKNLSSYENLKGILVECNLEGGNQAFNASPFLSYGISITDPCISYSEFETLLLNTFTFLSTPSL